MPQPLGATENLTRLIPGGKRCWKSGGTLREVVERAAEELADAGVRMLGITIAEVEYVVPEAIYRRL